MVAMTKLIWSATTDGCLGVKSAYYVAREFIAKPCPDRVVEGGFGEFFGSLNWTTC